METVKLIGIRHTKFFTDDGSEISGTNLYYLVPVTGSGSGQRGEKVFVSSNISECLYEVGDTVTIIFNRYGKCSNVYKE